MINEEYTTKFMELLRCLSYHTHEKDKVQHFVSSFPLALRYWIEYDVTWSLQEFIGKLKNLYEQSKCKNEPQQGQKGKDKGKLQPNRTRPQHVDGKGNVALQKKFNATKQGHESHQQHRGVGTGQMESQTCGKEHLKRYFPQNQGARAHIYSAWEAQTIGDVGKIIPHIHAAMENIQEQHQASIIDIDGKICHQFISIFIDPRSNYNYESLNLVDKCGLSKELDA